MIRPIFFLTLGGPLARGPPGLCLPCLPYCYAHEYIYRHEKGNIIVSSLSVCQRAELLDNLHTFLGVGRLSIQSEQSDLGGDPNSDAQIQSKYESRGPIHKKS